ncbi:MAG TPA: AI-2E family transporter, partial [Clostridiales bacterium]|nr:AI-2E family transporter [Clostridiales bacterium]
MLYWVQYDRKGNPALEEKLEKLNSASVKKILLISAAILIMAVLVFNYAAVFSALKKVLDIVFPFIFGGALAFIFNVPLRSLETRVLKKDFKGKRGVSILLTLLFILAIVAGAMLIIVPQVVDSIQTLIEEIEALAAKYGSVEAVRQDLVASYPWTARFLNDSRIVNLNYSDMLNKLSKYLTDMISKTGTSGSNWFNSLTGVVSSIVSGFATFFIGFAFSIYCLFRKEALARQMRQILYALFKKSTAEKILEVGSLSNMTFSNFIRGQCLEAVILGTLFLICMSILRMPYVWLVAVLIAITALVPIFGAFIGCFISALLLLIVDPKLCIEFLILFIILQQIEGKLIYPHVVGSTVGLPSIWVLFAITVGGELMGIAGMVIFVPLCSVLYALFRDFIVERLKAKKVAHELYEVPYEKRKGEALEAMTMKKTEEVELQDVVETADKFKEKFLHRK